MREKGDLVKAGTDPNLESRQIVWLGVVREFLGDKIGSKVETECRHEVAGDVLHCD